jgi:glycosyltransferase 2 family protein
MFKKTFIALAVSGLILAALLYKVDLGLVGQNFLKVRPLYILWYLISFAVFYLLASWRWQIIAGSHYRLSLAECFRQIAATSSVNVIVPSKLGTLGKAIFLIKDEGQGKAVPTAMVIYEKLSEMMGMCVSIIVCFAFASLHNPLVYVVVALAWGFVALFAAMHLTDIMPRLLRPFEPKGKWGKKLYNLLSTVDLYCRDPRVSGLRRLKVNLLSLALWVVHCFQMILFFWMLDLAVNPADAVLGVIAGVVVGLLPIALAGIGTRDLAIVYVFRGLLSFDQAVSLAMLFLSRYLISALVGLPFLASKVYSLQNKAK